MLPYCVYVLYSLRDVLLYHGFTTNLGARLANHNQGKTKSTKGRRPLMVIHSEYYLSKSDALRRERYFKTTMGKRMLKLILRHTLMQLRGNKAET
ncbi:GIY-YIG nuclease family protein [Robiginitalea sp. M366]|nr:GIY-YIG nuclease family protein [Robiginitalea aestuariiviva]MDG1571277.1 GIY-YIG nuclease family protein [Robiginitalea aestuariiviva]